MGTVLEFEVGCRRCINLVKIEKGTFCCGSRVHMDDSPVIPVKNNRKTPDWGICSGEDYFFTNS